MILLELILIFMGNKQNGPKLERKWPHNSEKMDPNKTYKNPSLVYITNTWDPFLPTDIINIINIISNSSNNHY